MRYFRCAARSSQLPWRRFSHDSMRGWSTYSLHRRNPPQVRQLTQSGKAPGQSARLSKEQKQELLTHLYSGARAPKAVESSPVPSPQPALRHGTSPPIHVTSNPATSSLPSIPYASHLPEQPPPPAARHRDTLPSVSSSSPLLPQARGPTAVFPRDLNPACLPFNVMYEKLRAWHRQHLSCHVPRSCGDAVTLGAWVRHMRRLQRKGKLEQWKVDKLNMLGFEWKLSDVDAKWINMYHQLRRYKSIHGHTRLPTVFKTQEDWDWRMPACWLKRQAKLLAKGMLSQQKQDMLRLVGVSLAVHQRTVAVYVKLQGLNKHERRLFKKKWKWRMNRERELRQQQGLRRAIASRMGGEGDMPVVRRSKGTYALIE